MVNKILKMSKFKKKNRKNQKQKIENNVKILKNKNQKIIVKVN